MVEQNSWKTQEEFRSRTQMEEWALNGGIVHFLRRQLTDPEMGVDAGNWKGGG